VSPRLRAQVLERVQVAETDLDLDHPARETRSHFEAEACLVIDLLPALRAAERDAPTYALRNTHWNERGNATAARQIAESLARWCVIWRWRVRTQRKTDRLGPIPANRFPGS